MDDAKLQGPVAVAVSGGLDSLYSLLALREAGAEVMPLHALFLPPELRGPDYEAMLGRLRAELRALGLSLHVADLSAAFEERVIQPFVDAYLAGQTPNPCALCNREMKFGLLWEEAARLGAARLATGHYARLEHLVDGPALFAGDDPAKDQSYFLSLTPLSSLARAVFPLARRKKSEIAHEFAVRGIEPPQKSESQEICFIADNDYRVFLRSYAGRRGLTLSGPGPARLPKAEYGGEVLGRHQGLWAYTQGQRHGLGIAWREPLYVMGKDLAEGALIVGPKSAFGRGPCICAAPNCLVPPREWPDTVLAKTRYRQRLAPARAELFNEDGQERLRLYFLDAAPQAPAAPGQLAALYAETPDGLRLLAGAEILY